MHIAEIASSLPNGLHDSCLRTMMTDFVNRTAVLTLDVWLGDLESIVEEERERYRLAQLELTGLDYLFVDPPSPTYPFREKGALQIDLCDADEKVAARFDLPGGVFAARFFISHWNAFIHFAALEAHLTWLDS